MRRVPAILLVLVFSFSPIGPALFVDADSNLPACCRRDGKHHCGMMVRDMAGPASSGPVVDALRTRCPSFPSGGALLPHSRAAMVAAFQTVSVSIGCQIAGPAQAEAGYRVSFSRGHQKRGPPRLSS